MLRLEGSIRAVWIRTDSPVDWRLDRKGPVSEAVTGRDRGAGDEMNVPWGWKRGKLKYSRNVWATYTMLAEEVYCHVLYSVSVPWESGFRGSKNRAKMLTTRYT